MTTKFHEYCDIFPSQTDEEFVGLVADIKANGQRDPCLRFGGKVFEGKHRWLACEKLGREPLVIEWSPKAHDPKAIDGEMLALVLSKNLHRRHLSQSQKAIIIARYLQSEMGVNQFTPSPGQTQKSAAESVGVSRVTMNQAAAVVRNGAEEVVDAVQHGEVSVKDAAKVVTLPKKEQRAAVKKVKEGKAKTLAKAAEPKNADAVRRNGKDTVKQTVDDKEVTKAFGAVVRLIDTQATACGLNNSPGHREATATLNKALEAYQSFTTDCRSVLARK